MYYYSFSDYLKERYGTKVRRISLDAGFTCPHKDKLGRGGCIYCNELGFSRFAGKDLTLEEQIERSISYFKASRTADRFIAYFQNATNTNAPAEELRSAYDVIRKYPEIVALSISTRPDCVDDEKLDLIASYKDAYEVWIEYGVQTMHDRTLKVIGRGHTAERSAEAIRKTADRDIKVGTHVILGLPGESDEDMIVTAREISGLPVSGVKLHVLHVLKDTELERFYREGEVRILTREGYVKAACDFLENLKEDCVILRLVSDADKEYLVAPVWMNDKPGVIACIEKEFGARGTRQGCRCFP